MSSVAQQITIAICVACISIVGAPASSVSSGQVDVSPSSYRDAEQFHARLMKALASGNRKQVAELFRYPMQVRVLGLDSRMVAVKDAATMVSMYPLFFGPALRCAIEQDPMGVAAGVLSLAGGSVVAQHTTGEFRIMRLTVSLEPPRRPKQEPRMVLFVSGRRPKQFAGRLAHDEADTYAVLARSGQLLQARIERFPGRAIQLRVVHQDTARVIKGGLSEFARTWAARLPQDGKYRIEVLRRSPYCDPDVTYLLELSLR